MEADVFVKPLDGELPMGATPALSEPRLIIKIDDTYWMPLAMVAFRRTDATGSQIAACDAVAASFEAGVAAGGTFTAVIDASLGLVRSDQSTDPNQS
ncbi:MULTISPECIES: hypothetical protein [unclassified Sphingomonas]|uniref:hypothetical protein n=1 Tax=unclassified Sphingomonas TaxID=196159 RepID=UPI00177B43DF|nr:MULTISPECIES: hypothetical protein [unclassified Sphingomonas]MBD8637856.1 hypothetical protein [Sphingomonas sp. CFBP 13733]MBP2511749.1 hypothetical protein [Sphingomonas sp. PvP018]